MTRSAFELIDPRVDFRPRTIDPLRVYSFDPGRAPRKSGRFVLYWSQIFRRPRHNHALNYAIERANELGLPVVVYEGLRHDYPWASDRIHVFMLQGAQQSAREFSRRGIPHIFLLERNAKERRKAVSLLAKSAALVVTDFYPCFIIPRQSERAGEQMEIPLYAVDSCGVAPLALFQKEEYAARTIRPKIHRALETCLQPMRDPRPENQGKDAGLHAPWATDLSQADPLELAAQCDIDHTVAPVKDVPGGYLAADKALADFVEHRLARYAEDRNHPDRDGASGLSPYLHFGHLSPLDAALAARGAASVSAQNKRVFLEELIVRRELSYNFTLHSPNYASLDALPDWIQRNLRDHSSDAREWTYTPRELEKAQTHDEVWNAAQRQIVREGRIHNYVRMLWGKKIIEWTKSYAEAFKVMVHLNNKYALDGRDPNSWTGILWCFGKHDRAWQTTPVLGTIRPMSTKNARRKIEMEEYLKRFGGG